MDRWNGLVYLLSYVLMYLTAPVVYVGVVQAALCDKLGASATVANLPSATYLVGGAAPLICSLIFPHRLDRTVLIWCNGLTAGFIGMVWISLSISVPQWFQITILVLQGLLQGFSGATAQVYTFQCLARGTTVIGRSRAFKRTFALTPICAVLGSLGAQFVLSGGIRSVLYPYDFALLYLFGLLCMAGVTLLSWTYRLAAVPEDPPLPFFRSLAHYVREYFDSRPLLLLFCVYGLWYCALSVTANLSLYTRHAMGSDPKSVSGLIMAVRFGCKALGGYALGAIALRYGLRTSVLAASALLAAGVVWGWVATGYAFLFAFGLLGAGELGGAYIPNLAVTLSRPEDSARNASILTLASAAVSFSPALRGYLTDRLGFPGSFILGLLTAGAAMLLTQKIAENPGAERS